MRPRILSEAPGKVSGPGTTAAGGEYRLARHPFDPEQWGFLLSTEPHVPLAGLAGRLHQVHSAREFLHPSYMVFPHEADSEAMQQAIEGLLILAHEEQTAG